MGGRNHIGANSMSEDPLSSLDGMDDQHSLSSDEESPGLSEDENLPSVKRKVCECHCNFEG